MPDVKFLHFSSWARLLEAGGPEDGRDRRAAEDRDDGRRSELLALALRALGSAAVGDRLRRAGVRPGIQHVVLRDAGALLKG